MRTTTTTKTECPKCNGKGVINQQMMMGVWSFEQCDCQPAESKKSVAAELRKIIENARKSRTGCGESGQITRGQNG